MDTLKYTNPDNLTANIFKRQITFRESPNHQSQSPKLKLSFSIFGADKIAGPILSPNSKKPA